MTETMRADARRNHERVLDAARAAFAEQGTDVSLREVARRADVGIGTLYRHFPTREALIEAAMRHGLDALCARADELRDTRSPGDALVEWLDAFAASSVRYDGLPASLLGALEDERSELHRSCQSMHEAAAGLLRRAQQAGEARPDVTAGDLLTLTAGIAWANQQGGARDDRTGRLLDIARTGFLRSPARHSPSNVGLKG
jgi:AcrR family transcriptional regulator